jgi:hypothetical protein
MSDNSRLDQSPLYSPQVQACLNRGAAIAEAMVRNARQAQQYWALWEALNTRLEPDKPLRKALEWHPPAGFAEIRRTLGDAAILATLRVSDNPKNNDALTACLLIGLLHNEDVVEVLNTPAWIGRRCLASDSFIVQFEIAEQPKRIAWLADRVPLKWGTKSFPPDNDELATARATLKDIRDKVIAHTDAGHVDVPTIEEIRHAVRISAEVARTAALIFLGSTGGLHSGVDEATRQYDDFWHFFENGLVATHTAHENAVREMDKL